MSFFRDIQRKAANIRSKKQAEYYRKLRRDTKLAGLKKAKLERVQQAKREKLRVQAELKALKPKRKPFRMPKLVGDLNKLTAGMPTDEQLNQSIFGSSSPKRPQSKMETGPSMKDLDQLSKDIFK